MSFQYPNAVIQIFCKAPETGKVKTRLMPELTANQAVEVHQKLTHQTLKWVTESKLCPVQLCCTPPLTHPFFIDICNTYQVTSALQSSGDLGARMNNAIISSLKQFNHAVIIGCDCVSLNQKELADTLEALTKYDMVLAPAEDGGYCMIGMNKPQAEIFTDISWGTSHVLDETRKKIRSSSLTCLELETQWDVDDYSDYLRYLEMQ